MHPPALSILSCGFQALPRADLPSVCIRNEGRRACKQVGESCVMQLEVIKILNDEALVRGWYRLIVMFFRDFKAKKTVTFQKTS